MKLCCLVNPFHWCYQCSTQFCRECISKALAVASSSDDHSHAESGKWDFYPNKHDWNETETNNQ